MRALSRAEVAAGVIALVLGVLHLVFLPDSGTDLAAQLARGSFAREAPLTPVDLSWYSGVHPFGYSVLTPWVFAVFGVALPGVVAATAAAVLFARLVRDLRYPLLTAAAGAFFSVADVVSGRTTFALSAVTLLAALLVRHRRGPLVLFAVLTALLSPVGAAFLGLIAAVLVLHRAVGGWTLGIAATVPVLVLAALFPSGGVQPFGYDSATRPALLSLGVALLTRIPMVRTGALLYAAAVLGFAATSDPFGSNVLRLGYLIGVPVLLASYRRPAVVAFVLGLAVLSWQVKPLQGDLGSRPGPELRALTAELVQLRADRVEVVPPREHRESWVVAASVPLARGWGRQIDYRDNRLFYTGRLTASAYLAWLAEHAVDHVAVPRRATVDFGGTRERGLLKRPVPGLTQVWQDRDWTLYAVDEPVPLASAPAAVVSSSRTALTVSSPVPGPVHVVLRWSRWLSASGPGCIERDRHQVVLRFREAGTVVLGSSLVPHGHC